MPCPGRELSVRSGVGTSPWIVSDELWDRLEPLLPQRERRFRYPGRRPLPDRDVLCGILYVLHGGASCTWSTGPCRPACLRRLVAQPVAVVRGRVGEEATCLHRMASSARCGNSGTRRGRHRRPRIDGGPSCSPQGQKQRAGSSS
ncbi:transposase [Streptomyces phaeochromogenes]|nr:transposase [Streptomyces phaeochromogenes]